MKVALHHRTRYRYERSVSFSPHDVRLRPAAHCRAPILAFSLTAGPAQVAVTWRNDAFGNHVARLVFGERASALEIAVDLVANIAPTNPFDFILDSEVARFPFSYPGRLPRDLAPYLAPEDDGPRLEAWLAAFRTRQLKGGAGTVDVLVSLNQRLQRDVAYRVRMDPGVQTCDETLERRSGSCRDSGWLLVQLLRRLGVAARFVSGYLIQLAEQTPPSSLPGDHGDLHAWAEAYLPGAGWLGLDPTSGMLAQDGHIPLACAPSPADTAPVSGRIEPSSAQLEHETVVERV